MKIFLLLLFPIVALAQPNTEIYVFDLETEGNSFHISNPRNISRQNPGYDNQPHFIDNDRLYYVGDSDGQTDVIRANIENKELEWLTQTAIGGEYSPTPMPEGNYFSAIRLDTTGFQRLYKYPLDQSAAEILIKDKVVGYHVWLDNDRITAFILGDPVTLQLCSITTQKCKILDENIGRSLHKIPNSKNFSYISKETKEWQIRAMDPETGESKFIVNTLPDSEDITWLADGTLISGSENKLYKFHPDHDNKWKEFADLSQYNLTGITRLTVNPSNDLLAVVVNQ